MRIPTDLTHRRRAAGMYQNSCPSAALTKTDLWICAGNSQIEFKLCTYFRHFAARQFQARDKQARVIAVRFGKGLCPQLAQPP